MGIFRSEDIELYKLTIHKDSEWKIMNELGKLDALHFIDLNQNVSPNHLPFTSNIKQLDEALKKIDFIERQYAQFGLDMKPCENIEEFFAKVQDISDESGKPLHYSDVVQDLDSTYDHIMSQKETLNQSVNSFKELVYKIQVLEKIKTMTGNQQSLELAGDKSNLEGMLAQNLMAMKIIYIGGVMKTDQLHQFKRLIIRATRCQVYVHSFDL